jgi:RNA polymerase sigma factor (sigma-70 family)
MTNGLTSPGGRGRASHWFTTTHWSVVLAAGEKDSPQAQAAWEQLARSYWFPLYAYVRRRGYPPEDAQDATQEFFARFLEKESLKQADSTRGKFRAFLLTALQNFLVSEQRKAASQKRGDGQRLLSLDIRGAEQRYGEALADPADPETLYERHWALAVMERVLSALRQDYVAADKAVLFDRLVDRLWGEGEDKSYGELGLEAGMSEVALRQLVHRLRRRCRELLRLEVAHTVARPEELDEELRYLVNMLRR